MYTIFQGSAAIARFLLQLLVAFGVDNIRGECRAPEKFGGPEKATEFFRVSLLSVSSDPHLICVQNGE